MSSLRCFMMLFLHILLLASLAFGDDILADDEVEALKDIGSSLGKDDWDFSVDPCSVSYYWNTPVATFGYENNVTCDNCSINGTNQICHITSIVLSGQNLQGTLPRELVRLPYLQTFDVSFNYLNGSIPKEWGSMNNLIEINLRGNRIAGSIPMKLANISTLKSLVLQLNQLSGTLPPELGNLTQLEKLLLTSNNFSGEIPATFARLTALQDFRVGDNQLIGKIPSFIQNWTNLKYLVIRGSGLSGPIPSGVSLLTQLIYLIITDLNGTTSTFPQLENLTNLDTLILRSCNINGPLPEYLGRMKTITVLDLSFNNLSGPIPSSYVGLENASNIYLTGNLLSGPVPDWTQNSGTVDLSYNKFSIMQECQRGGLNLFASSSPVNDSGTVSCLSACPTTLNHSLHINCGGKQVTINGSIYDADLDRGGPAKFQKGGTNWAYSNTGDFWYTNQSFSYKRSMQSCFAMDNEELYKSARISAISLTYYGYCLANGSYTVKLHFAEIMFTNDETYSSLGRRIFDVYIQRNLVLKDFNIAKEAGGVSKITTQTFTAEVTNKTLEIRFQWAGKGTTAVPFFSVYGPLISAISAELASQENGSSNISAVTLAGILAAAGVITIMLVFATLWWRGCRKQKSSLEMELKALNLQTGLFSLRQIKAATNNFDMANKIGEGGFGPVYMGTLLDGTIIAVKQLSSKSKQGNREFLNEIGMISALQHPCLVKLYGCCVEGNQLLLIYEYMENNSLARALFGREEFQIKLDWPTRYKICVGIAKGLAYLHEESRLKIVHRDIKATNVLLDKDLNPKISDFGLAKLDEEDNTHISTRIAGTHGYMAPEYAMHGYLTDKADVYSFGIVTLEILNGKANNIQGQNDQCLYLLDWAHLLKEKGNLMELVDRRLGSEFIKEEAMVMIKVALLCTNVTAALRPTMSSVVSMLEGSIVVPEFVAESNEVLDEKKLEVMRQYYQQVDGNKETEIEKQSASMDGPWAASSSSAVDLYPTHLDSAYWDPNN